MTQVSCIRSVVLCLQTSTEQVHDKILSNLEYRAGHPQLEETSNPDKGWFYASGSHLLFSAPSSVLFKNTKKYKLCCIQGGILSVMQY